MRAIRRRQEGVLEGKRVLVVGAGPLGLMTSLSLASNGAEITLLADSHMSGSTGVRHAAGLVEPVATSDPRAAGWFKRMLEFCAAAVDDPQWGIEPRSVLFMSDYESTLEQEWLTQVTSRPADAIDLRARRSGGKWFDTYVIQPDIAIRAFQRELDAVGIRRPSPVKVPSIEFVAERARKSGMDAFVLAAGLGLAGLQDVKKVVGAEAGLTAGLGLTIRMPLTRLGLEYVLMDADDLTYVIPQRNQVVCGGTNIPVSYDDELVLGKSKRAKAIYAEWEADVRARVRRISAEVGEFTEGDVRVGARPLRNEVLTAFTEVRGIPGLILGGAGGSGWTFSVGIADDACTFLSEQLAASSPAQLQLELIDEGSGKDVA